MRFLFIRYLLLWFSGMLVG